METHLIESLSEIVCKKSFGHITSILIQIGKQKLLDNIVDI